MDAEFDPDFEDNNLWGEIAGWMDDTSHVLAIRMEVDYEYPVLSDPWELAGILLATNDALQERLEKVLYQTCFSGDLPPGLSQDEMHYLFLRFDCALEWLEARKLLGSYLPPPPEHWDGRAVAFWILTDVWAHQHRRWLVHEAMENYDKFRSMKPIFPQGGPKLN